ncbi:hypothetical protein M422DRAFT_44359 [Sphaerobolus stellatus SS14]|nr:hypothetical protein M422DRAFT_44359 [Sphaerobolus stellatus SS14]
MVLFTNLTLNVASSTPLFMEDFNLDIPPRAPYPLSILTPSVVNNDLLSPSSSISSGPPSSASGSSYVSPVPSTSVKHILFQRGELSDAELARYFEKAEHKNRMYVCNWQGCTLQRPLPLSKIREHVRKQHFSDLGKPWACSCKTTFSSKKHGERHCKTASKRSVPCSGCGKDFSRSDYLKAHQKDRCCVNSKGASPVPLSASYDVAETFTKVDKAKDLRQTSRRHPESLEICKPKL